MGLSVPEVEPAHQHGRQRASGHRVGGAEWQFHAQLHRLRRQILDLRTSTCAGTEYNAVEFTSSWNYDSRNRSLFADRGMRHSFGLAYTLPGISDVEYYVASYEFIKYVPLFGRFTLQLGADFAYGMDIGDTTALPPYRQFYAGGPETVRGYQESRLGPKDDFGRPFGGNLKVTGRAEVLIPLPQKFQTSARLSWFYDVGNVFSTGNRYKFYGPADAPVSRSITRSSMIN